jgi:hypothetical protein
MRLKRPRGAARKPVSGAGTGGLRGLRPGPGVVRAVSVTAAAAAACAMWATPAGAAVRHASTTSVSVKPTTAFVDTKVKLSASIKSAGKTPTGTVTFWFGTRKLCVGHLSKGSTSCSAKFFTASTKKVKGAYSGDSSHKASSGTAKVKIMPDPTTPPPPPPPPPPGQTATTTTITSPADISAEDAGTPFTVSATVTSANGTVPTGTVTFKPNNLTGPIPSVLECTGTLVNGTASCVVTPALGTWGFVLYTATYSGDPTHAGSVSTGEHKLITWDITSTLLTFNPSPATAGDPVTLTADVTDQPLDNLASAAGGPEQVTFSIGGVAIPGCSDVNITDPTKGPDNIATCTYTPTTAAPVTIKAAYLGDEYALPSSDTETLTVNS